MNTMTTLKCLAVVQLTVHLNQPKLSEVASVPKENSNCILQCGLLIHIAPGFKVQQKKWGEKSYTKKAVQKFPCTVPFLMQRSLLLTWMISLQRQHSLILHPERRVNHFHFKHRYYPFRLISDATSFGGVTGQVVPFQSLNFRGCLLMKSFSAAFCVFSIQGGVSDFEIQ